MPSAELVTQRIQNRVLGGIGKERIEGQRDIYTIPAEGGTPVAVTADAAIDWNPVWSPDGRHSVFLQQSRRQHERVAGRDR